MRSNATDFDRLIEIVRAYFDTKGMEVEIDGTMVRERATGITFWLENLAQVAAGVPREGWPGLVADHFTTLLTAEREPPTDYRKAAPHLRVRLAPDGYLEAAGDVMVARPLADNLHEVLMIRREPGAHSVAPRTVRGWGMDPDEVLRTARNNTM
ncbi:MAG: hypothetical protein ACRDVM_01715, partial [Acidimicrobiia bacterium]